MREIWAERAQSKDLEQAIALLKGLADRNLVDWSVIGSTVILKAANAEKNIMFLPVQTVFMLESLGINPEASALEVAKGLERLFGIVRWEAQRAGHAETYFLCNDEQTVKFAEHHGMEKVTIPLYRFKVKPL